MNKEVKKSKILRRRAFILGISKSLITGIVLSKLYYLQILQKSKRAGVKVFVNYNRRFDERIERVKNQFEGLPEEIQSNAEVKKAYMGE